MGEKIYLHSLPSTSSYLREKKDDYGDFSFVTVDEQTAGHGRNGRSWLSEAGSNLTFSFILKEKRILDLGPKITLVVACLIAQAIEELGISSVSIKWPNDIYINEKKAVGILLEGSLPEYLIVGVGINVNQREFPGEYRIPPTSLSVALGHPIDLACFREKIFALLERRFSELPSSFGSYLSYFQNHDYLYGKKVHLDGQGSYLAMGIDEEFRLLLKGKDGIFSNASGEVRIDE